MGKGEDFERDQCRYWSLWWTDGERDDVFWRKRVRKTIKTPNAEAQLGDLGCDDPVGEQFTRVFNVECKSGYSRPKRKGRKIKDVSWCPLDLLDSKQGENPLLEFWEQAERDAGNSERDPMLVFKRDYRCPCVCITTDLFGLLESFCGQYTREFMTVVVRERDLSLVVVKQEDFCRWLPPETVKLLADRKWDEKEW